ncbi:MAG: aldo/keto reductase [Gammaproteobacteria bacterium]
MISNIALNDGTTIPQLGFGTLHTQPTREPTPENSRTTAEVVGLALQVGYRHLDTAQQYGNEKGVGLAIAASGIDREDLYITSKLGNRNHRPADVRRTFEETLNNLGLDYLDLFLIHWPLPTLYDGDYVSTWKAMAALVEGGRLRTVGVSNFQPAHLDRIISATGVTPAVNQIEVHPYHRNDAARLATLRHGIVVEAWSPLAQGKLLDDPVIGEIARAHGKSAAQVVLRWHLQHGHVIFPKTARLKRMRENFALFDFELSADELARIDMLDRGGQGRIGPNPDTFDWLP